MPRSSLLVGMEMANKVNLETTTHVAGPPVRVGERIIQRCPVCGDKLADSNDKNMQLFWQEGELVKQDPYGLVKVPGNDFSNRKRLPADFCIDLVEE